MTSPASLSDFLNFANPHHDTRGRFAPKSGALSSPSGDAAAAFAEAETHFNATATDHEKAGRDAYIGGSYRSINDTLRAQRKKPGHGFGSAEQRAETASQIDGMDSAFRHAAITSSEPIVVHRKGSHAEVSRERGSEMINDGFLSTSHIEGRNANAGGTAPVEMHIHVPAGTKLLAGNGPEGELILNRGTRLRTTGSREVNFRTHIDLEVVP